MGSFIKYNNSEVAKDTGEQNKRHGENLWPHAHLRVKMNIHSRHHPQNRRLPCCLKMVIYNIRYDFEA